MEHTVGIKPTKHVFAGRHIIILSCVHGAAGGNRTHIPDVEDQYIDRYKTAAYGGECRTRTYKRFDPHGSFQDCCLIQLG